MEKPSLSLGFSCLSVTFSIIREQKSFIVKAAGNAEI